MAPGLGSKRDYSSDTPKTPPENLSGWAGIEDHLMKHDVGWVKDYADDIDTLLVFAGLFSAVLTAFVVETYTLLLPDSSETTNQILTNGFASFTNGTAPSPLSPPPFIPPTSARWINALFFISLVFSLAAAFFGILAKQWLREYMQWNSPLSTPRENVVVRQIRFEAWEAWNVAATISSIPALLELAMILFLVGIIVLLWTIDNVTAIVVTVVVVAFLVAATAFTILPVFSRRCPYKSPTAWACVVAIEVVHALFIYAYALFIYACTLFIYAYALRSGVIRDFLDCLRYRNPTGRRMRFNRHRHRPPKHSAVWWPDRPKAWRARDIKSIVPTKFRVGRWWEKSVSARDVAKRELDLEATHINEYGKLDQTIRDPRGWIYPASDAEADALLLDIGQTAFLLRSLSWVRLASQDTRIGAYIDECLETIHPDIASETPRSSDRGTQLQLLASWCVLLSLSQPHQPLLARPRTPSERDGPSRPYDSPTSDLRKSLGIRAHQTIIVGSPGVLHVLSTVQATGPLVCRMLVKQLRAAVKDLETTQTHGLHHAFSHVRRIAELYNAVRGIQRLPPYGRDGISWVVGESCILGNPMVKDMLDSVAPKLRAYALGEALWRAKVTVDPDNKSFIISEEHMSISDYEALLIQLDCNFSECTMGDLRVFLVVALHWVREHLRLKGSSNPDSEQTFGRIIDAIGAVSSRNKDASFTIRAELDNRWVIDLVHQLHNSSLRRGWRKLDGPEGRQMRHLVHTLEETYSNHSFQSSAYSEMVWYTTVGDFSFKEALHKCLEIAHKNLESCDHPNCAWTSHTYDGWETCPLLPSPKKRSTTSSPSDPAEPTPGMSQAHIHSPDPSSHPAVEVPSGSSSALGSSRPRMSRARTHARSRLSHSEPPPILPVSNPPSGIEEIGMNPLLAVQEAAVGDSEVVPPESGPHPPVAPN